WISPLATFRFCWECSARFCGSCTTNKRSDFAEQPVGELVHAVDQFRRGRIGQRLGLKPVGDSAASDSGVARGLHIHSAVAHHQGNVPAHARLAHECFHTHGVWLFEFEAVAAVYLEEVTVDAESVNDRAADANWF